MIRIKKQQSKKSFIQDQKAAVEVYCYATKDNIKVFEKIENSDYWIGL